MTALAILLAWLVVTFPLACVVGRWIREAR